MFDQRHAFYAACGITTFALALGACLALLATQTPAVTRIIDALIYISIAGALAIFGLLGYKPDKMPPEPG
jgi:hypothetical protein